MARMYWIERLPNAHYEGGEKMEFRAWAGQEYMNGAKRLLGEFPTRALAEEAVKRTAVHEKMVEQGPADTTYYNQYGLQYLNEAPPLSAPAEDWVPGPYLPG